MKNEDKKIIVVDDNPILLELLVDTLETIGYTVSGFDAGQKVLDQLSAERFDLLISDIKMPEMNGIELLGHVREQHPELPVLFISVVDSLEIYQDSKPDGFVSKPFRITHIEEQIKNCLNKAQQ